MSWLLLAAEWAGCVDPFIHPCTVGLFLHPVNCESCCCEHVCGSEHLPGPGRASRGAWPPSFSFGGLICATAPSPALASPDVRSREVVFPLAHSKHPKCARRGQTLRETGSVNHSSSELPYDPAVSLLGMSPRETRTYICTKPLQGYSQQEESRQPKMETTEMPIKGGRSMCPSRTRTSLRCVHARARPQINVSAVHAHVPRPPTGARRPHPPPRAEGP